MPRGRDPPGAQYARLEIEGCLKRGRYNIDLGAHLAECDGNYLRLIRLLPQLREGERREFFVAHGGVAPQVTVEVTEHRRYTAVVALRQRFPGQRAAPPQAAPGEGGDAAHRVGETRIKVRLYHDARCAEVIEFQGQRLFAPEYDYPNAKMRQPDEKAQVNRFLREFLNACLAHGVATEEAVLTES